MSDLIKKMVSALDYALNDKETEELKLEFRLEGASYQEDERSDLTEDENPGGMFNGRYLGDMVALSTVEVSTSDEHCRCEERIDLTDIKQLRDILKEAVDPEQRNGLGRAIIAGIIKGGLVTAEEKGLNVWKANADEVLEAIVADWSANAIQCESCENYATLGEYDSEGVFVCSGCLPPEGEK